MQISCLVLSNDKLFLQEFSKERSLRLEILRAETWEAAIRLFKVNPVNIVIIDREDFSEDEILFFVKAAKEIDGRAKIVFATHEIAAEEMLKFFRVGVSDLLMKPVGWAKLRERIHFILSRGESEEASKSPLTGGEFPVLPGVSSAIERVKMEIIGAGTMRLLFYGETGAGKGAFARWANFTLSRKESRNRPFQHINCANLKRERFLDELFGHVRGAFTGAFSEKKGLVELATGGDLFLDEIGDLDCECQAELLTFLDNYEYFKLGGTKKLKSKVRIISATNRSLEEMIANGTFRSDLYSRISQCVMKIPVLRERREDIPFLSDYFIKKYSGVCKPCDTSVMKFFKNYLWMEGNVRELEQACEYMCYQARNSNRISIEHVDRRLMGATTESLYAYDISRINRMGYRRFMMDFEKMVLLQSVRPMESIRKNALRLKMDRASLGRKIARYRIPVRYDHKLQAFS